MFLVVLLAAIQHSVIPLMDDPPKVAEQQINCEQLDRLTGSPLRVMSFNMLFDCYDHKLAPENRWPNRKERIVEYIRHARPDLIGSQELQENQRAFLLETLGNTYCMLGAEEAIFYRKGRLELLCERTTKFYSLALFKDLETGCSFTCINTHLSFGNSERRLAQTKQLVQLIRQSEPPVIVTGDFNTFPMRPELPLPFYDGDYILTLFEESGVKDARTRTHSGHFGTISSTNFSTEKFAPFESNGEPGVILDHIMITPQVKVKTHAIDPAQVDGYYPSDHFPVIADLILPPCG